jgi:uncharacterized protein
VSTPVIPAETRRRPILGQTELIGLGVLAILLAGRWIVPLLDHPVLQTWNTIFLAIVIQSVPFLVMGVVLSGAISVLLSERVLTKVVPRNPALGVPVAGVAGIGLPGCECAAVPIAGSLMRRGVVPAVALTFLLAAPAVNPAVIVSTAVAFPGKPEMVLARFLASMATAIVVGWICLARGARLPLRLPTLHVDESLSKGRQFVGAVRHDFLHAVGFLIIGAMLAAAINTVVPQALVETVAGQALLGILTLAAFAFFVALCSESDAFVAASLTAFSDTAKLVFLVVGPAMDVKLASMETGQFGSGFSRQFVPLVLVTAVLAAVGMGALLL